MDIRLATDRDLEDILELGQRSLGWLGDEQDARFFRWKHLESPFGKSPMWIAEVDGRLAGFRTFMRWDLRNATGARYSAVRAVDTATDPDFQGHGIFTKLTLHGLDKLEVEGVDFVFNTPNDQSRPGYVKMGWQVVGRLRTAIRPTHAGALPKIGRARQSASLSAVAVNVGTPAREAFADTAALERLITSSEAPRGLHTRVSPEYLAWRYGLDSLHYRVVTAPDGLSDGFAVFRLRRRGPAIEAVISRVCIPAGAAEVSRALLGRIAREAGADYLIRLGAAPLSRDGFVRVPGAGPTLAVRSIRAVAPTNLKSWHLGMGEIELF